MNDKNVNFYILQHVQNIGHEDIDLILDHYELYKLTIIIYALKNHL